jgi:signal transduction histidine kinase
MPLARSGLFDLSGWDMAGLGPVRLDGEWELYPHRLLMPGDFGDSARTGEARGYVLPAPWNREHADGKAMASDAGYATLRLRLGPNPGTPRPALYIFNVSAAYRLWIDGVLAAADGVVGTDAATESPRPSGRLIPFADTGRPVELVLQVSNFHYRDGGLVAPMWLGPQETLQAWRDRSMGAAMFFVGSFFVMGLYHLALYFFRPKNVSPLYFALYCFAWMGNYAASDSSGFVLRLFVPGIGARLLDQLALSCFFVSIPVGFAFFRSLYPAEFSRRLEQACVAICAVFVAVAVFASGMTLAGALPAYYLASSLLIGYCLHRLHAAWRRGRDEAAFLFAGFCVLGVIGINDMLTDMKLLASTPLLPVGMLVFSLCQAFALSRRLSRAFASEERLSAALEEKNLSLTAEMAERTRLEREIVTISEEERRRISLELHDGLCQGLTAARLRCDALAPSVSDTAAGRGDLARLSGLLDGLVDQAYDLSRGLWPLEHDSVGVGPSFGDMVRRLGEASAIPMEFHRELACETCRNPHMAQLYRIAQEAVTNAVKHSRASRIVIALSCPGGREAVLTVCDDGRGLSGAAASPGGLGLGIMAHRARLIGGSLRIEDAPDGGVVVICAVPCRVRENDSDIRSAT